MEKKKEMKILNIETPILNYFSVYLCITECGLFIRMIYSRRPLERPLIPEIRNESRCLICSTKVVDWSTSLSRLAAVMNLYVTSVNRSVVA